jgi:uncharacterized membrane protein
MFVMLAKERKNSHTFIAVAFVLTVMWTLIHVEDVLVAWSELSDFTGWLPYPPSL